MTRLSMLSDFTAASAAVLIAFAPAVAQETKKMTPDEARAVVRPFYDALTATKADEVAPLLTPVVAQDWKNCSDNLACETLETSIKRWSGRIAIVPGMSWVEEEMLVSGNSIVVRGKLAGTPTSRFLGIEPTGRSFDVMTIDIHTVRDGRISMTHHVENWALAIRQLSEVK